MKTIKQLLSLFFFLVMLGTGHLFAEDTHFHAPGKAPHNGRVLETKKIGSLHVEFLIEADKTVSVYLFDGKLKAVAPSDQTVTLTVQGKADVRDKVDLVKKEDRFVSSAPLTLPDGAKAVLTIKAGGKTENLRFELNMAICEECHLSEYACSCGH